MAQTFDFTVRRSFSNRCAIQLALCQREQRVVDQRRFTGAGHAGDTGKQAHRQRQRDIFQVVAFSAGKFQHFGGIRRDALRRYGDFPFTAQELAGQ
ncbi:hypothetical protein SRABI106_04758 [Rahnella aquatilis]|nr:hypothetical protein SRABI106_04758 [Rahnella aquatilis]